MYIKKFFMIIFVTIYSSNIYAISLNINIEDGKINEIPLRTLLVKKNLNHDSREKGLLSMVDNINGLLSTYIGDGVIDKRGWIHDLAWKDEGIGFNLIRSSGYSYEMNIYFQLTEKQIDYKSFKGSLSKGINKNTRREFLEAILGTPSSWLVSAENYSGQYNHSFGNVNSESGVRISSSKDAISSFKIIEPKYKNVWIAGVVYNRNGFDFSFYFNESNGKLDSLTIGLEY